MPPYRSDSSGTTYNWVDFLAKASPAWKDGAGVGLTVRWPTGQGGAGNAGVAALVKRTPGAIGYVEYSYAVQEGLAFGRVQNVDGLFVAPDIDRFQDAAATVRWQGLQGLRRADDQRRRAGRLPNHSNHVHPHAQVAA